MPPSSHPSQPPADRATSTRSLDLPDESSKPASRSTEAASPHDHDHDHAQDDAESPSDSSSRPGPSVPLQQRRRVTRACDECRRKKIKCDGKQPCTHCQVYSYGSLIPQEPSPCSLSIAHPLPRMHLRQALEQEEKPGTAVYRSP